MADLKAQIRAQALIRRAQVGGAMALVAKRGDPDAGLVFVKVLYLDGRASLYAPTRTMDGASAYRKVTLDPPPPESEADDILRKEQSFDPDLWVVEIEDRQGRHFLVEPVLD